jgi:hypothetical protein
LRTTCKQRYGRASLTIRRWNGLGDALSGDSALSKTIDAFREGDATSEDVAWAFVRDRIASHSSTFKWQRAELERLIRLVVECSESPRFYAETADDLATELVHAQDAERELLRELSDKLAGSFDSIQHIGKLMSSLTVSTQLSSWAEQQRRTVEQVRKLVRPVSLPHSMLEELPKLALAPKIDPGVMRMVSPEVRLPPTTARMLSGSMRVALSAYPTPLETMRTLSALASTRRTRFQVSEVFQAAREAALLAEEQGQNEQAVAITTVTAEVSEVVESGSLESLERAVGDLAKRLETDAEKRDRDRRDDLALSSCTS